MGGLETQLKRVIDREMGTRKFKVVFHIGEENVLLEDFDP